MSISVSYFPDTAPVRHALSLAEAYPNNVSTNKGKSFAYNHETQEFELRTDTFVVGRHALLSSAELGNVSTIRCKTFLSLGKVDLKTLRIFANNIVLVNSVKYIRQ